MSAFGRHISGQIAPIRQDLFDLLGRLPDGQAEEVEAIWARMVQVVNRMEDEKRSLEREVRGLKEQVAQLLPRRQAEPSREPTNASDTSQFGRQEADRVTSLMDAADINQVTQAVRDITPKFAERELAWRQDQSFENELGCKQLKNKPTHANGYVQVNLQAHEHPNQAMYPGKPLRGTILAHQLSLIAAGRADELAKTGKGASQVSHLCHNASCYNAEHLVVEPANRNRDRNTCQGHKVIRCECKAVFHPCSHWNVELGTRRCKLPWAKAELRTGWVHRCGPDGEPRLYKQRLRPEEGGKPEPPASVLRRTIPQPDDDSE